MRAVQHARARQSRSVRDLYGYAQQKGKNKKLLRESRSPLSVEDIVALLGEHTDLKSVYEDLGHVAKSVRGESRGAEYVVMIPPTCRVCGFAFKSLDKPKTPSKCPRCQSERISSPLFKITTR